MKIRECRIEGNHEGNQVSSIASFCVGVTSFEPRLPTMQFEDFSPTSSSPQPETDAVLTTTSAATTAKRFFALSAAVDAALKGDFGKELAIGGNDQLTALAKNVNRLFDMMRPTGPNPANVNRVRSESGH